MKASTRKNVLTGTFLCSIVLTMRRNEQTKKTSPPLDWHKAYIVAALHASGTSLRKLSVEHGYKPSALKHALHSPWPKAERMIAEAIGEKPHEIWPSRYTPEGYPLSKKGDRQAAGQGRHITTNCNQPSGICNVKLRRVI